MKNEEHVLFLEKNWWLTVLRGLIAITLGMALFFFPEKTIRAMAQFIGLYWLTSGIGGIAWGIGGAMRPGLWLLLGIAEITVGTILLFRGWLDPFLSWTTVNRLAAAFAIMAGLLHLVIGIRTGRVYGRKWSWGSFFMGVLQITLGLLFFRTPDLISRFIMFLVIIWAFIGGFGLIANGLRLRQQT